MDMQDIIHRHAEAARRVAVPAATHQIEMILFNEETGERRKLTFRGLAGGIKIAAFDEQVRLQGEGFFFVSARIDRIEEDA